RATEQFSDRLDALCEKFAKGFDCFLQNPEDKPSGEHSLEAAVQDVVDHIEASAGKSGDTLKAAQGSPNGVATWSAASIDCDRPLSPVIARLENRIADLADQIVGHDAAQEDLRKLVQSGFDGLAQRIDATKLASEAAAQRAQNQAVRLAQEELRKLAHSE